MADEDRLRELLAKATERPWEVLGRDWVTAHIVATTINDDGDEILIAGADARPTADDDAALIVEGVNSLPDLLSELAQLREQRNRAESQLHEVLAMAYTLLMDEDATPQERGEAAAALRHAYEDDAALSRSTQGAPKEDEDDGR